MDSNKDEALKCINIAKEAISSGDKKRAVKFIGIARRLNQNLPVDDLLVACEKLESNSSLPPGGEKSEIKNEPGPAKGGVLNGERNYTQEHVQLIRQVKRNNDYYAVLGVEKSCSVEEIRKAYRKLSLKVHPDKNKAPGSEEAFKKVCKAFKCLSDDGSRRQYDQTGLVEDFEYNQQHNVRRRTRTSGNDFFDNDFDPDEIFRAFFGQTDRFRTSHIYRARGMAGQSRQNDQDTGPNFMILLQILPFIIILLLTYLPSSEPGYSLNKNYDYQFSKKTENHGIEYFVRSSEFDQDFPLGSLERENIEDHVVRDYKDVLRRYCHRELHRRQWNRNLATPHCEELRNFGVA